MESESRERARALVRYRILSAARELIDEKGPGALTMRRVAKRIDCSATAIYLHFRDKESLVRELCQQQFVDVERQLAELSSSHQPLERIGLAMEALVRFAHAYPHDYRMLFLAPLFAEPTPRKGPRNPPIGPAPEAAHETNGAAAPPVDSGPGPRERVYEWMQKNVSECMTLGSLRGDLGDAERTTCVLWAGLHGFVALDLAGAFPSDTAGLPEAWLVESLLRAVKVAASQ